MDKKESLSWKFYALLGTASIGIIGGLYYLYNLFSNNIDYEMSEQQESKFSELQETLKNIKQDDQGPSQSQSMSQNKSKSSEMEFVKNVLIQINKLSEEMFQKEFPDYIKNRRDLLRSSKKAEYIAYCEQMLGEKMRVESLAAEIALQKLNMSQYDLQTMMERIPQEDFMKIQQEIIATQQKQNQANPYDFTQDKIIKAFKTLMSKKNELDAETRNLAHLMNDTSEEARMNFFIKLEIHKYMIDDHLTNEHGLDCAGLLLMIEQNRLGTHPEIAREYNMLLKELYQFQ